MVLEKYSFGIGDRFGQQGHAQLAAFQLARDAGIDITPVWNKSHREHTTVHTVPADTRAEADSAVAAGNWGGRYRVDADHINLTNVDAFLDCSDFFTIDVAHEIGRAPTTSAIDRFITAHKQYVGRLHIPDIDHDLDVSDDRLVAIAEKFLLATVEAGRIYRHIEQHRGAGTFVTEVSIDECDEPQSPLELFFILSALATEGIPVQTIAPKFTGRFNKGVDYVGDVEQFSREFNENLAVIAHAVSEFGLPTDLKLSVHSGSDKFSIYRPIHDAIRRTGAGLHVKTAGTTWLEELIGLAESGSGGLTIAQAVYRDALARYDELCAPYSAVIDIDTAALPTADDVDRWDGRRYVAALRHDQACHDYNAHFRQLLHVAYKVAAEMGERYTDGVRAAADVVGRNVTTNIFDRHIRPIFLGH